MEENNIDSKILRRTLFITTIASLIITIITRFNLNEYVKYSLVPVFVIIISYTIFTLNLKSNKKAYYYLGYIFLILGSYFILPIADVNKFLNIIVALIMTSVYVFSLINNKYKISLNSFRWLVKLIPGYLFSNMEYIEKSVKTVELKNNKVKDFIKGLLIGVPIIIVLFILLTKADMYFGTVINKILSLFTLNISIDSLIEIGITLVLSFIFIFSTCINIYQNRNREDFDNIKVKVSEIVSYVVLSLVSAVYVLFLISEISKLTTNFLNVPIEYTYAEYAREGFFELLGVSTINFAILIFYLNFVDNLKNNKIIKYLLYMIIGFSIFIIFNSYYRMGLYIFEYGFTILRLQVILFLTLELIFFIILCLKLKGKNKGNNFIYLVIMLVTYFLNVYLCNDLFINFINNLWGK